MQFTYICFMHILKRIINLSLLLTIVVQGYSQKYSFVQYSVKDGLAQTQVYAISSDDEGYLWFGTAGGVSKFDGENFNNYSSANGLVNNVVIDIKSHQGYTWIITSKGITSIKGNQINSFDLLEVINGSSISCATISKARASLIIAIKNQEIMEIPILDSGELDLNNTINLSSPLGAGSKVRNLFEDNTGKIWVASKGFVGFLDESFGPEMEWKSIMIEYSNNNVSDIKQDKEGNYWISVYDEGLYMWNNKLVQQYTIEEGLNSNLIRSIYIDKEDRVWTASKNGVSLIDGERIASFTSKNGLPNNSVEKIFEDNEGNIWLASDGSGVFRYTSDEFVVFDKSNGLGSDYVMTITEDQEGKKWFGTYGNGVSSWNGKSFEYYNVENQKLCNNVVWSSLTDRENNLWFGTSNGLMFFSENEITTFKDEEWMPSNKITSLYDNSSDSLELWVGSSKGLSILKSREGKIVGVDKEMPLRNIRAIEKGINSQVWLGTSKGVYVTDGNFLEPWIYNDKLDDKVVYAIENYKDSLWFIGTSNGLYATDGIHVDRISLSDAYSSNYINFIKIENDKYAWIGTNFGIFEIDLSLFFKDIKNGIKQHTENSGIASVETNLNAVFEDKQGQLWMGTGEGLIRFDRSKRIESKRVVVPNVYLKEVQLFLKKTDWKKYAESVNAFNNIPVSPSLSHKKNYLTFYFDAVALSNFDQLRYRIKLDGLDEDWSPLIWQNSFTYTNLSYGDYTFNVKASTDGKNWSETLTFDFTIRKPYYLKWWFFLLVFLALLGLVLLVVNWQIKINKRKRLTEKLLYKSKLLALEQQTLNASMNRHFIFNALNSIQYYINSQDRLSANRYLTSFAKLIRKNLDSSVSGSGLVTVADEIERLELYITLEHMRFKEKFEYIIDVKKDVDVEHIKIPAMILQPFVENSIWHGILPQSEGGKISIRIFNIPTGIQFEIEDNGIGYDVSKAKKTSNTHHSRGMLITAGRIEIMKKVNEKKMTINGPYQMNNEAGESIGTKVEITLENL